jgi:hypothetical protein
MSPALLRFREDFWLILFGAERQLSRYATFPYYSDTIRRKVFSLLNAVSR